MRMLKMKVMLMKKYLHLSSPIHMDMGIERVSMIKTAFVTFHCIFNLIGKNHSRVLIWFPSGEVTVDTVGVMIATMSPTRRDDADYKACSLRIQILMKMSHCH